MAKSKTTLIKAFLAKPKRKRRGIHAKTKTSKSKTADNYVKLSRGQG